MSISPAQPQPCFLFRFNHFDPTWRRCWDRPFVDSGRRFASYREIETAWIDDALGTAADGQSCFMVEATWVLRHYVQRRPEQLAALRRLAQEGRFELLGSGENIVDSNMIHGELLVRNLVLGTLWGRQMLGVTPNIGWDSDGFGSSAQVPQIFRGCGYRWVPALSYNTPDAPYWRGLDGSTIFFEVKGKFPHAQAGAGIPWVKYPPCPECRGVGCASCGQRGFAAAQRSEFARPPEKVVAGAAAQVLMLWGEEILPGLNVARDVAAFNAKQKKFQVRQGIYRDLLPYLAAELAGVDDPPADQVSTKVENNPSQTGCYVSRIKIKQLHRAAEHELLGAETLDALYQGGAQATPLREAWREMTLSGFHDAITSSHCDPAYDELVDLLGRVRAVAAGVRHGAVAEVLRPQEHAFTVFNTQSFGATAPVSVPLPAGWEAAKVRGPQGQAVGVHEVNEAARTISFLAADVPPLGGATYALTRAPRVRREVTERKVQFERWGLVIGDQGITSISVEGLGVVTDTTRFMVGELVLEADVGDPWSTRTLDRTRWRLSPYTKLAGVEEDGGSLTVRYTGRHPSSDDPHNCADPLVTWMDWTQAFRLRRGVPWMDVQTSVRWYTQSRRLRLMFPSSTVLDRGVYDVPYGVVERDRYEGVSCKGGGAAGDWPAIHWAGVQADDHTLAVFNRGTPSYRVEDGVVGVSVVRSPQIPYGLHEPQSYAAYNYHGMEDGGDHHFEHALFVAPGHWRDNNTGRQATVFNGGLSVFPGKLEGAGETWSLKASHTQITAVKQAEDGMGIVLRLVETSGRAERVRLVVPAKFQTVHLANMLEEPGAAVARVGEAFEFEVGPWKIVTLRLS